MEGMLASRYVALWYLRKTTRMICDGFIGLNASTDS